MNFKESMQYLREYNPTSSIVSGLLEQLINKVNVVTGYFRHGHDVSMRMLVELSNRQVEVEEKLAKLEGRSEREQEAVEKVINVADDLVRVLRLIAHDSGTAEADSRTEAAADVLKKHGLREDS